MLKQKEVLIIGVGSENLVENVKLIVAAKHVYFDSRYWSFVTLTSKNNIVLSRGGSRIFSWGGRIFKKISKILTFFFLVRPNFLARAPPHARQKYWRQRLVYIGAKG